MKVFQPRNTYGPAPTPNSGAAAMKVLNQVRASGSYNGSERDVTDWYSVLV